MNWGLIVEPAGQPGHENMRKDYALLCAAQEGAAFLRIYSWAPGCLSFGRNEPALRRYDRQAIERLGLDTVRRPTGGRAVWHETEVTYAVAAPLELFGGLTLSYRHIHELVARALGRLGARLDLAPAPNAPAAPGAGACFAAAAGGELQSGGRKIAGSAQIREGSAFLQHGSILLRDRQDLVARVTTGSAPAVSAAGLAELLGRDVTFDDVAAALASEAASTWSGEWTSTSVPSAPPTAIDFSDPGWTWRR